MSALLRKTSSAAVRAWQEQQCDALLALDFSSCGCYLAAGSRLGYLTCWDVASLLDGDPAEDSDYAARQRPLARCRPEQSPIHSVLTHRDLLLAVSRDQLHRYSWSALTKGSTVAESIRLDLRCTAAVVVDDNIMVVAGDTGAIWLVKGWAAGTALTVQDRLEGHSKTIHSLALGRDGQLLASAAGDGQVRLWDLTTKTCKHVIQASEQPVYAVALDPEINWLACGGHTRPTLWSLRDPSGPLLTLSPNAPHGSGQATDGDMQTQRLLFHGDDIVVAGDTSALYFFGYDGRHRSFVTRQPSVYACAFNDDRAPQHLRVLAVAGLGPDVELAIAPHYNFSTLILKSYSE